MDQELIRYSILIAAHKKRSKNEVCVYTGKWNDCKVTYVTGMNIGVKLFFKINFTICCVHIKLKKK